MDILSNLELLNQTHFDSGALGGLGMVVHRLTEPGTHRVTVLQGDKPVQTLALQVLQALPQPPSGVIPAPSRPAGTPRQTELHLDLGSFVGRPGQLSPQPPPLDLEVAAQGYAVFHAPPGTAGFAVQLSPGGADNRRPTFDSRQLRDTDIFATTLLRPGRYSLTNAETGAKGEIRVSYPVVGDTPYRPPEPFDVQVSDAGFEPGSIELKPAQGVIFHINKTRARIQIDLVEPDDGPGRPGGEHPPGRAPLTRWEKPTRRKA